MLEFHEIMISSGIYTCFRDFLVKCVGTVPEAHRDLLQFEEYAFFMVQDCLFITVKPPASYQSTFKADTKLYFCSCELLRETETRLCFYIIFNS